MATWRRRRDGHRRRRPNLRLHVGRIACSSRREPFTYQVVEGAPVEVPSRFALDGTTVRFEVGDYDTSRRTRHRSGDRLRVVVRGWRRGGRARPRRRHGRRDRALRLLARRRRAAEVPDDRRRREDVARGRSRCLRDEVQRDRERDRLLHAPRRQRQRELQHQLHRAAWRSTPAATSTSPGTTRSTDFPTTAGAFDTTRNNPGLATSDDGFYAQLSPTGGLLYGTYLGGNAIDIPWGLDVDAARNVYIVGRTSSIPGADPNSGGFTLVGSSYQRDVPTAPPTSSSCASIRSAH